MVVAKHRGTVATINLAAIKANIQIITSQMTDREFFAVVKADAYGHGAVRVAKAVESLVSGFCVAMLDEAIELRQAGIKKPILVLGLVSASELSLASQYDITVTIDRVDVLKDSQLAPHQTVRIHVAVNTGMNRIGVQDSEILNQLERYMHENPQFQFEGIFTHMATADGEDDNRVQKQYERFEQLVSQLEKRPKYVHLANSAMSLWRQQYPSDIARIGIAMYGLNPSDVVLELPYALEPALTWQTEISHVHRLKKGEAVSYGAKYIAKQDEWIGVLPVGYADGWRRHFSQESVYIDGQKCAIIGVVCMDQMMVRLPKAYAIGTRVELIGPHQSASDLAVSIGTIGYEVLCGISQRVPRVYSE